MNRTEAKIFFWFVFIVYGVPTLFLMMAGLWDAWPLMLWGGAATVFAFVLKEASCQTS